MLRVQEVLRVLVLEVLDVLKVLVLTVPLDPTRVDGSRARRGTRRSVARGHRPRSPS